MRLCLPTFVVLFWCSYAPGEESVSVRRYDAGPLTVEDFKADVPDPLPKLGRLTQYGLAGTDIRFTYEYRYRTVDGEIELTATKLDVFGIFLPEKSWLYNGDANTLDHEQGHFDITQTYALHVHLHLRKQIAEGKSLIGRGEDVPAAVKDLEEQIRAIIKPAYERADTAQLDYDRETKHGTLKAPQAEHRKAQLKVLKELVEELSSND